jgi:hypothetical protein
VRGRAPVALGIAACLIEDANGYDVLLAGENTEAKTAMLACARLIRAALPVRRVAENLKSPNKLLAMAAERYLESEDSPEARQIVLSLHPNEAKIMGARTYFAAAILRPQTALICPRFSRASTNRCRRQVITSITRVRKI